MANKHKIAEPIYQKIAIDIASKIAAGKYKAGEKIYGRSMLAAHYAVSPETIRRAMFMLQDVGIVAIESGSGSTVLSAERASQLVSRFRNISTITELKKNIETLSFPGTDDLGNKLLAKYRCYRRRYQQRRRADRFAGSLRAFRSGGRLYHGRA